MKETILAEVECLQDTAADMEYYNRGRTYTVDVEWAKSRGIWSYFHPLQEIPATEAD